MPSLRSLLAQGALRGSVERLRVSHKMLSLLNMRGFDQLQWLDLSHNRLRSSALADAGLQKLTKLKHIDLSCALPHIR